MISRIKRSDFDQSFERKIKLRLHGSLFLLHFLHNREGRESRLRFCGSEMGKGRSGKLKSQKRTKSKTKVVRQTDEGSNPVYEKGNVKIHCETIIPPKAEAKDSTEEKYSSFAEAIWARINKIFERSNSQLKLVRDLEDRLRELRGEEGANQNLDSLDEGCTTKLYEISPTDDDQQEELRPRRAPFSTGLTTGIDSIFHREAEKLRMIREYEREIQEIIEQRKKNKA